MTTGRRPIRSRMSAVRVPPNPEPTTATSAKRPFMAGFLRARAVDRRKIFLRQIHLPQSGRAGRPAVRATARPLDIPQINEDAPASQGETLREGPFQRLQPG